MNNRIIKISDGREYHCAECPYCDRETGFCGFCMKKVLDDMAAIKANRSPQNANPNGNESERGQYDGLV